MSENSSATHNQLETDDDGVSSAPVPAQVETGGSPLREDDYAAIADAVMETERGRWFLKEYARRNRHADTETVLSALERLEEKIDAKAPVDDSSTALISHNVIDLADAISQVKREVQDLGGDSDDASHFNSATSELEAIVAQTETATGEILEAAEKVQEVVWTLRENGVDETQCDIIESKIIDIYTACSFQDLTGQRSNKVVRLVGYVEKRVLSMMDILGLAPKDEASSSAPTPSSSESTTVAYQEDDARSDAHLLHGPALAGDAIEQDDVDALFGPGEGEEAQPEESLELEVAHHVGEPSDDAASGAPVIDDSLADHDTDEDHVDIFTDADVVELHDAEILDRPADENLMADAVRTDGPPADIFDVDTLEFDGPDMDAVSAVRDDHLDGLGSADHVDDMMMADDDAALGLEGASALHPDDHDDLPAIVPMSESVAEQDIFEVEGVVADDLTQETGPSSGTDAQEEDELDDNLTSLDQAEIEEPDVDLNSEEEPVPYTDEERIALFS